MYQGVDGQQANSSVTLLIKGLLPGNDIQFDANTKFNVAVQSLNSTLYGTTHIGTLTDWNDSFAINMKDLQTDNLVVALFVNDEDFGRSSISLMDIATGTGPAKSQKKAELKKNDDVVGYLSLYFQALAKEQIVGGLRPPKVTLRSGAIEIVQPFTERGIQKNAAKYLNLFSCMDASDMGWQPYPYKFKSRLRQTYDIKG